MTLSILAATNSGRSKESSIDSVHHSVTQVLLEVRHLVDRKEVAIPIDDVIEPFGQGGIKLKISKRDVGEPTAMEQRSCQRTGSWHVVGAPPTSGVQWVRSLYKPEGHRGDHPRRRVGPPDLTSSMAAHTMVLHSFLRRPQGIGLVKQEGWKPQEGGYPTSKTPWQSSSTER